jgi:FkbM family methyltransferase
MRTVDLTFSDGLGKSHQLTLEYDLNDFVQSDIWRSLKTGIFYEHETSTAVLRIIRPGDTFLDIGANVGYFSLLVAKLVGAEGRVVSFEPNPRNCAALAAAAARNQLDIVIEQVAVAEHNGTALFCDLGENDSNGIFHIEGDGAATYEVNTVSLDSFMTASGTPAPKMIKIDVEGAEMQVLRGGSALFSSPSLEFVICEFNVPQLHRFGSSMQDIVDFMDARGLSLYQFDNGGGIPRFVPPGVSVRMTSVANVLFARHTAIAKYWPEVVNECYVYCMNKGK